MGPINYKDISRHINHQSRLEHPRMCKSNPHIVTLCNAGWRQLCKNPCTVNWQYTGFSGSVKGPKNPRILKWKMGGFECSKICQEHVPRHVRGTIPNTLWHKHSYMRWMTRLHISDIFVICLKLLGITVMCQSECLSLHIPLSLQPVSIVISVCPRVVKIVFHQHRKSTSGIYGCEIEMNLCLFWSVGIQLSGDICGCIRVLWDPLYPASGLSFHECNCTSHLLLEQLNQL